MTDESPRKLIDLLRIHSGLTGPLGETTNIDQDDFKRDLAKLDHYLQSHYRIMLILLVAIFVIGIGIAFFFVDKPEQASAVIAVVGLGAGGAVKKLGETGREIANLRLVVALSSALNSDQLTLVTQALAAKL